MFLQDLEKPGHDLEETTFGEEVDTEACQRRKEEKKSLLERNLACINFVLIVLGILCITFMVHQVMVMVMVIVMVMVMVHQGGAMLGERAAAPTLGLIVCFYSVTTGVAYFARKLTPLKSNTKINAAGYPVPRCITSELLSFNFELQMFYQPPSLLRDQLHLWHLHPIGNGLSDFLYPLIL